jgi:class 3 adenylate cyclase
MGETGHHCAVVAGFSEPAAFVGREQELSWLRSGLDEAAAGRPRFVIVEGDAGVGKSRLVRHLQQEAAARGVDVSTGRCREHLELPYLPLTSSLLGRLEGVARSDPDLAPYAGVISRVLGTDAGGSDLHPDREQAWLFYAVTQTTAALTRSRPQLLVIDDVQWADPPTLDLLAHLILECGDLGLREPIPLFVIATHRTDPMSGAREVLSRLRREELTQTLTVRGLGETETAELVRALGIDNAHRRLVRRIYNATLGNPLFVESVVRSMLTRVRDQGDGPGDPTDADLAVPAELASAVTEQISAVGPDCLDVLVAAAYTGDPIRLDVLASVTGRSPDAIEEALHKAAAAGLVDITATDASIAHPLVANLLHAQPDYAARRALHADVANALVEVAASPLEVAAHLIGAGEAAPPETTLEWCRAGGEEGWRILAWDDAARAFDAAATAAQTLGDDASAAALFVRAGAAHYRNMDPQLSADRFQGAVDHFRRIGDVRGMAAALMEQVHARLVGAGFGTIIDTTALETVAAELDDDPPGLQARVAAQLAETKWVAGDTEAARELATRALDDARAVKSHDACARAQVTLAVIDWMTLELPAAETRLHDALTSARASGDAWLEGLVLPRLALTRLWLGRLDAAHETAQRACANADQTHDLAEHSLALAALIGVAIARGQWDEAERLGERAWTSLRLAQYWWASAFVAGGLVSVRARRGDRVGAEAVIERWRRALPAGDAAHIFATFALDVARGTAPSVANFGLSVPVGIGSVQCMAAVAEFGDPAGDGTLERLTAGLAYADDHGMVLTEGLVYLVARARGLAAAAAGNAAEAELHFRAGIEEADSIGARPEGALARLDYARLLESHDPARAGELAEVAAAALTDLELAEPARAARALAAAPEAPAPVSVPDVETAVILLCDIADSTGLTERLGDVAYRERAESLDGALRTAVVECGGKAVEGVTLGDGILALFGSARRALDCAGRAHDAAAERNFDLHVGLHAGDVTWSGNKVFGGAINIAARVCDAAAPAETLVSDTVRSLARTSGGVEFADRGVHSLKGITEPHQLFAVTSR